MCMHWSDLRSLKRAKLLLFSCHGPTWRRYNQWMYLRTNATERIESTEIDEALVIYMHQSNLRPHKYTNWMLFIRIGANGGHQNWRSACYLHAWEQLQASKTHELIVVYSHWSDSRPPKSIHIYSYVHASEWLEATHVIESIVIYTHRSEAADISECVVTYAHWTLHKIQGVKYSLICNSSATESAPRSSGGLRGFRIQLPAVSFEHLICCCD